MPEEVYSHHSIYGLHLNVFLNKLLIDLIDLDTVWALTFGAETGTLQVEDALQQGEFLQDDAKAVDVTLLCSTWRGVVGTQKLGGRPQLAYICKHWYYGLLHTHAFCIYVRVAMTHVHRKRAGPPSCSPCGNFPDHNLWSSARSGCPPRSWKTSGCHERQWRCCGGTPFPEWWKDDTLTKTSDSIHRIYQHRTTKILIKDSFATAIMLSGVIIYQSGNWHPHKPFQITHVSPLHNVKPRTVF